MTIIKLSIAAVAMALSVPTIASEAGPAQITLDHDGRSYVYTVREQRNARIIEGVEQRMEVRPDVVPAHRVGEGVRGDREAGRHGQSRPSHRAEAGALPADDRLVEFVVVVKEDGVVRHYHDTPS